MIVLIKLLEKNDEYFLYSYGYDEDNLDGKIKIYFDKERNYELVKESSDPHIGKKGTLIAICKLIKARDNGKLSEILCYQS